MDYPWTYKPVYHAMESMYDLAHGRTNAAYEMGRRAFWEELGRPLKNVDEYGHPETAPVPFDPIVDPLLGAYNRIKKIAPVDDKVPYGGRM
jgi:hypothetical protein